ncbi:hypothetical protein VBZ67_03745 [Campylobacter concisus]
MTLTADKNGDGLISSDEIGDGTSKVEMKFTSHHKTKRERHYKHRWLAKRNLS